MPSKTATLREKYKINDDGLIFHARFFARCGDSHNIYILPESGKRGVSYLGLQKHGRYWYAVELIQLDNNLLCHPVNFSIIDSNRYAGIEQAAKQLINLFEEEEKWYESIFNRD